MQDNIKIAILGGGLAGYLTALYIVDQYPKFTVTVIEDPSQPPIQVGESGNVLYTHALESLGVNIKDWVKNTDAIIKLGGVLENWKGDGTAYFHSRVSPYHDYIKDKSIADLLYLKDLFNLNLPIYQNFIHGYSYDLRKVPFDNNKFFVWPSTMFHFDSRKNAEYLKKIASTRGIKIINGVYSSCGIGKNNYLSHLELESGEKISADWFFDCSGMSKLLLKKIYQPVYRDLSRYFLARSVITWFDDGEKQYSTKIQSRKYGWQWTIDTRSRRGNGYVYSKDFISTDEAIIEIGTDKHIQASFDWPIEYSQNISINNVIALGLSAGFLEPLEANGILTIIKTLNLIRDTWTPYSIKTQSQLNIETEKMFSEIVEFLCLHYQCDRNDSVFWKAFKSKEYTLPFQLKEKIIDITDFLTTDKNYLDFNYESYSLESWLMIIQATKNLISYSKVDPRTLQNFNYLKNNYKYVLSNAVGLNDWLKFIDE